MKTIRYIHWKDEEADEGIQRLENAGFQVVYEALSQDNYSRIRKQPPDALVINLSRLPSHGREVALYFRSSKSSRHVPIVFVEGQPEKVERVKQSVPDAVYTSWRGIRATVNKAIKNPPKNPVVPESSMGGYSGTPLAKKLGIKSGNVVALVNAPEGFQNQLANLPDNVSFKHSARGKRNLTIWFVLKLNDLENRIDRMADAVVDKDGLWIAWAKKSSGVATDVTQNDVRKIGLASGLVDYKICAIDETWSGLKFARRK